MELTKEEEAKLTNYKGDINALGSAEKLVKATLNIPFAFLRIEAMLYRETFEDEIFHLKKSFSILEVNPNLNVFIFPKTNLVILIFCEPTFLVCIRRPARN